MDATVLKLLLKCNKIDVRWKVDVKMLAVNAFDVGYSDTIQLRIVRRYQVQ